MLSRETVAAIKSLLERAEMSQREIARRVGISRGTVNAIANGRRPERTARPQDEHLFLFRGPVARCPGCGGRVYLPCLLCRVREAKKIDRAPRRSA